MPKERRASSATPSSRRAPSIGPAPRTASTTWTSEEDEILMRERAHGSNWGPISAKHFPSKTPNACRKRHERLMERRRDEDWDELKLENLATQYMEVRREMWGMLANRIGEKFVIVEQKVSSHSHILLIVLAFQFAFSIASIRPSVLCLRHVWHHAADHLILEHACCQVVHRKLTLAVVHGERRKKPPTSCSISRKATKGGHSFTSKYQTWR